MLATSCKQRRMHRKIQILILLSVIAASWIFSVHLHKKFYSSIGISISTSTTGSTSDSTAIQFNHAFEFQPRIRAKNDPVLMTTTKTTTTTAHLPHSKTMTNAEDKHENNKQVDKDHDNDNDDDNFCWTDGSLTNLAISMARNSSASFEKLQRILSSTKYFYVTKTSWHTLKRCEENIAIMLEGYGLIRVYDNTYNVTTNNNTILFVDNIAPYAPYNREKWENGRYDKPHHYHHHHPTQQQQQQQQQPLLLWQSEQVYFQRFAKWLPQFVLEKVYQSPTTFLLEYSDYNYKKFMMEIPEAIDSIMMLPIMINNHHGKLGAPIFQEDKIDQQLQQQQQQQQHAINMKANNNNNNINNNNRDILIPLPNRTYDFVMFGTMTGRRHTLKKQLVEYNKNRPTYNSSSSLLLLLNNNSTITSSSGATTPPHPSHHYRSHASSSSSSSSAWTFKFEANHENLPNYYKDAKICLIVHSYLDISAMEYHRMSDFSRMGCIPVLEEVGDLFFVDALEKCANVRFFQASKKRQNAMDYMIPTLERIMYYIEELGLLSGSGTNGNNSRDDDDDDRFENLEALQKKAITWWRNEIDWTNLLGQILGPRGRGGFSSGGRR